MVKSESKTSIMFGNLIDKSTTSSSSSLKVKLKIKYKKPQKLLCSQGITQMTTQTTTNPKTIFNNSIHFILNYRIKIYIKQGNMPSDRYMQL